MKKNTWINRGLTLLLRTALLAMGTIVLLLCIFALPAMWRGVEEEYPTITYVFYSILLALYVAAIPFFITLFQSLKLLHYIDKGKAFSNLSVQVLKYIAYCGVVICFIFTAILPLLYVWAEYEDAPGLIVIGMMFVGASLTVSVFAAVMQRLLHEAITYKSENDLTV